MPVYVSISLHIPAYLSTYISIYTHLPYLHLCMHYYCQYLFSYLCIYASHSASIRSCWIIRRWLWTGNIWSHCTHRGKSLTFSACFFHCLTIILQFSLTLPISSSLFFSLPISPCLCFSLFFFSLPHFSSNVTPVSFPLSPSLSSSLSVCLSLFLTCINESIC